MHYYIQTISITKTLVQNAYKMQNTHIPVTSDSYTSPRREVIYRPLYHEIIILFCCFFPTISTSHPLNALECPRQGQPAFSLSRPIPFSIFSCGTVLWLGISHLWLVPHFNPFKFVTIYIILIPWGKGGGGIMEMGCCTGMWCRRVPLPPPPATSFWLGTLLRRMDLFTGTILGFLW